MKIQKNLFSKFFLVFNHIIPKLSIIFIKQLESYEEKNLQKLMDLSDIEDSMHDSIIDD